MSINNSSHSYPPHTHKKKEDQMKILFRVNGEAVQCRNYQHAYRAENGNLQISLGRYRDQCMY